MNLDLFRYTYPKNLIAQRPLAKRDASRMMVLSREQKKWSHHSFQELSTFLQPGDLMVFNDTRVFPARLFGKDPQQRKAEILLLEKNEIGWKGFGKPFKKMKVGLTLDFGEGLVGTVTKKNEEELEIELKGKHAEEKIERVGLPPLPPYIRRAAEPQDRERYQSIFAKETGSAAAPTASLHFTKDLMEKLKARGVELAFITLHVSRDTFLPIRVQEISQHKMHGERFFIPKETAEKIKRAKRVMAVGTTVVRALESDWSKDKTDLFITPGFEFKVVDALLTNFHQPASTLLLLVSAFASREFILEAYQEAITQKYRLFSYGDCMLIC